MQADASKFSLGETCEIIHAGLNFHRQKVSTYQQVTFCVITLDTMGSTNSKQEEAPCCFICYDFVDELGQPLRSNYCACRGSSGYCHLSCLAHNAKIETEQAPNPIDLATIWSVQ